MSCITIINKYNLSDRTSILKLINGSIIIIDDLTITIYNSNTCNKLDEQNDVIVAANALLELSGSIPVLKWINIVIVSHISDSNVSNIMWIRSNDLQRDNTPINPNYIIKCQISFNKLCNIKDFHLYVDTILSQCDTVVKGWYEWYKINPQILISKLTKYIYNYM